MPTGRRNPNAATAPRRSPEINVFSDVEPEVRVITATEVIERLAYELESAERYHTSAKKRMAEAMELGYIDASVFERLIEDSAILKTWQNLDSSLAKHEDVHEGVRLFVEDLTETLLDWSPSNSTSDIARVQDRARATAMRNVLRTVKHWV